ncbi:MAG: hypothetical protein AAF797_18065 [Planctomycetota bacterium]
MSGIPNNIPNPGLQPRTLPAQAPAKPSDDAPFLQGIEPTASDPQASVDPARHPDVQATLDKINAPKPTDAAGYDPFSKLESLEAQTVEHMNAFNELQRQVNAGLADPNDPAVRAALDSRMENLMMIQSRMHSASFAVELVSKVVEQGTSGAKQILQTQV